MDGADDKVKQALYWPHAMLQAIQTEAIRLDASLSWCVQRAWTIARGTLTRLPGVDEADDDEAAAARVSAANAKWADAAGKRDGAPRADPLPRRLYLTRSSLRNSEDWRARLFAQRRSASRSPASIGRHRAIPASWIHRRAVTNSSCCAS